jgi:LacI family transcriptional regulator
VTRARVTLSDVAARAGVSRTTASFVLTGRRDMRTSADTEQRVLQAARELNYRPNLLARNLSNNQSHTIGLLSDRITTDAFAGQLIRGALSTALLHNQLMFIGETGGDPQLEKQLVHGMLDRGVGGFLYACTYTRRAKIPTELRGHRLVLVNCISRAAGIPMVVPDEIQAGQTADAVLLGHGHRDRIVLVGETPPEVIAAAERLAGIRQVLSGNGLDLAEAIPTPWWPEPAYHAVRAYLAAGHRPTAFICLNDRIAMGAPTKPHGTTDCASQNSFRFARVRINDGVVDPLLDVAGVEHHVQRGAVLLAHGHPCDQVASPGMKLTSGRVGSR